MRKLIKLALVILGIRAFMRWRKSRKQAEMTSPAAAPVTTADPADELRRKLAESRDEDVGPATPETSVNERRAEVHEAGRAALDEMTTSDDA